MSNWFEDSPARSIVLHTIVVAGAVWAAFFFIFDENKINAYRAQVENEKASASQFKAKTEVLEVEIARLRDENKKYQDWLIATPKTIPHIEAKLQTLRDENTKLRQQLAADIHAGQNSSFTSDVSIPYINGKILNVGEAFIDQKTSATLGIGKISPDFTTTGTLTLPGQKKHDLQAVKSGDNWTYSYGDKRYQMTVLKVDWFSNKAEVLVKELSK